MGNSQKKKIHLKIRNEWVWEWDDGEGAALVYHFIVLTKDSVFMLS